MSLALTCSARELELEMLDPGSQSLVRLFKHPGGEWAEPPPAFRNLRVDPPAGHKDAFAVLYTGDNLPAVATECLILQVGDGDHCIWRQDRAAEYRVARYGFLKPALFLPIDGKNRHRLGLSGGQRPWGGYGVYQEAALALHQRFHDVVHGLSWESFHRNQPGRCLSRTPRPQASRHFGRPISAVHRWVRATLECILQSLRHGAAHARRSQMKDSPLQYDKNAKAASQSRPARVEPAAQAVMPRRAVEAAPGNTASLKHREGDAAHQFAQTIQAAPRIAAQRAVIAGIQDSPFMVAQRRQLQSLFGATTQLERHDASPNRTGMPDRLKTGIESLSGMSLNDVTVHYNSSKPAQMSALAYAQGREIHVAPGQEQHLPHEAWHVVQQAQGRVQPTMSLGGVAVNDDKALESEADAMGAQAMQAGSEPVQRMQSPGEVHKSGLASASEAVLQPVWVRTDSGEVSWVDTDDLSGFEATKEEHGEAEGHPKGSVYVKKKLELQPSSLPSMTDELDISGAALKLSTAILSDASLCIQFFQCLDASTLWAFSQTSKISREMAQAFVITYFPYYGDRFIFNLATKGKLLRTRPSEKYGGQLEKPSYPEHATSGFNWYSAALKGNGVMVLGDLRDYALMRDYDSLFHSKEQAKSVELNAKYLMAWPWSLLVNSALVTGAIHGGRSVVGASPIAKKSVFKEPDGKDTFGMTVYAREMIQLILKHNYGIKAQVDPVEAEGLGYPEPATGGGFLLTPTDNPERPFNKKKPYATIFDVGEPEESAYGREDQAEGLVSALNPPIYRPIDFDQSKKEDVEREAKVEKKAYDTLRKNLKAKTEKFENLDRLGPKKLVAMFAEIYPDGPKALPSIPRWMRVEYENNLRDIPDPGEQITLKEAATSADPEVSRYYDLQTKKSLKSMAHEEEGSFDEWAEDDEYFSGVDLEDWQRLTERFGPIKF